MKSTDHVNSNSTDLNTQVKLLESRLNNAVRSIEANEKEIEKLQSQVNGLGDMVESLKENLRIAAEHEARLSPLEQAVVFYDDYENCDLLSRTSHVRAARLLSKWETWSVPRPEGRGLHTQHENVKTLYKSGGSFSAATCSNSCHHLGGSPEMRRVQDGQY